MRSCPSAYHPAVLPVLPLSPSQQPCGVGPVSVSGICDLAKPLLSNNTCNLGNGALRITMMDFTQNISGIGHAVLILRALEDGIRVHERLMAATRRSDAHVQAESAKLEDSSSRLKSEVMERLSTEEPIGAICRETSKLLEDAATQIAALPTETQAKKSMLDRLKLSKKPSKSELKSIKSIDLQLKEQLAQLDDLVQSSLQQEAKYEIQKLSSRSNIDSESLKRLQLASVSLNAASNSLSGSSTTMYRAIQELVPQIEGLVAKQQQNAVLDTLKFSKLHERFDSITVAEANTYAWLLPSSSAANGSAPVLSGHLTRAKKTFLSWLETGSGFFYTSGKPGAGKSTLMKFICRNQEFYHCANRWAGDATLLMGRFFFWKPGQSEQKSINGMLRGLLYSVLEAQPDIAAVAMPELCESLLTDKAFTVSDEDVKNAFQNMLRAFATNKKYVLMLVLDGLDEFEGEHGDLLALMQSWVSQYPSTIKICVSSREYGIFEDFFSQSPKFRLHELTKDDMALLIASRFGTSKAFAKLPGRDLDAVTPLMVAKAEGVFLWVILAVSSLEDGMEAGDIKNAGELEGCVRRFPSELDDFLAHVHKSVGEYHRPWAYKAITLVHFAQFKVSELLASGEGYPGVGLAEFMLMDEASSSWNLTMFSPRSDAKSANVEERLEAARKKVLCRPKGFLAVSSLPNVRSWPASHGTEKLYMTFTHRSVVEYIESPAAQGLMSSYMGSFDPFFALASSDLAALRFSAPPNYPLLKDKSDLPPGDSVGLSVLLADSLVQRLEELVECAKALEKSGSTRFLGILDAIGDAIKRHLTLLLPLKRIRLAADDNSPHQILINMTLAHGVSEYSEWKQKSIMQPGGRKLVKPN